MDTPAAIQKYRERKDWVIKEGGKCYRLTVGLNLFYALESLTRGDDNDEPWDSIWIDAICINQDDEVEKGAQISLMGSIYTLCKRTIVWLGEEEDYECSIGGFLGIHEVLHQPYQDYILGASDLEMEKLRSGWTAENFYTRLKIEPFRNRLDWRSYHLFYEQCRWFTRVW